MFDKDVPENLLEFLLNTKNKVALFELFREEAANPLIWQWDGEVVITYNKQIWTKSDGIQDFGPWIDHVHEEADNRMVLHAIDMLKANINQIVIKTVATDAIIIFLSYYMQYCQ